MESDIDPSSTAMLYFPCGKMAAGKSTLSRELASRTNAVLIVQDELLERLYPGAIATIPDFVRYSTLLRDALTPHIVSLLSKGVPVVLDFPGNTRTQRAWFRALFEAGGVRHELHFIDASNELCKTQLAARSAHLPRGTTWTTEAEFDAITVYFETPAVDEGFNVVRHERG